MNFLYDKNGRSITKGYANTSVDAIIKEDGWSPRRSPKKHRLPRLVL
jgi:hypothetical protein